MNNEQIGNCRILVDVIFDIAKYGSLQERLDSVIEQVLDIR